MGRIPQAEVKRGLGPGKAGRGLQAGTGPWKMIPWKVGEGLQTGKVGERRPVGPKPMVGGQGVAVQGNVIRGKRKKEAVPVWWLEGDQLAGNHPFQVLPQGDDTVIVNEGSVMHIVGSSTDPLATPKQGLLIDPYEISTSGAITVTGTGHIVLELDSTTEILASSNPTTDTLTTYRLNLNAASEAFTFTETADLYDAGTGEDVTEAQTWYILIADVSLDGAGNAQVDKQYIDDHFQLHQDTYSELT